MRLIELEAESYGIFRGQTYDFGSGGFRLIYGPNEAGKSTLLELMREVLFGFEVRNRYQFERHGEIAASATIALSDGTEIRFRRRKGRKDPLVGEILTTGQSIDADGLAQCLGGANKELFKHVFGFSLAELASGEKSLEEANLNEALYGGGIGNLANFQRVQKGIEDESLSLFKPRGQKLAINALVRRIRDQMKDLRASAIKPADYDRLCESAQNLEAKLAELRGRLDELRRIDAHLERLERAIEPWQQLKVAEEERAALVVPAGFPSNAAETFRRDKSALDEMVIERETEELELNNVQLELRSIQQSPALVAAAPEIRRLYRQLDQIMSYRRDIPLRKQEGDAARHAAETQIRKLNPAWTLADLDRFQISLPQRETIERAQHEFAELEKLGAAVTSKQPALERQVNQARTKLADLDGKEVDPEAEQLVARASWYADAIKTVEELKQGVVDLDAECQRSIQQLNPPIHAAADEHSAKVLPPRGEIMRFRQLLETAERSVADRESRLDTLRSELERLGEELARLDAGETIVDRQALIESRQHRDRGWQIIRRKYMEGEDLSADQWPLGWESSKDLSGMYERAVVDSDALADQRQARAEAVAARDQLAAMISQKKTQRDDAVQRKADSEQTLREIQQAWIELWRESGLDPLSPGAMLDWLTAYEKLLEKLREHSLKKSHLETLASQIARFESQLEALSDAPVRSPELALAGLRGRVQAARDAVALRRDVRDALPKHEQELRDLDVEVQKLSTRQTDWQGRWKQTLTELRFPEDWDVELASKIIDGLDAARQENGKALDLSGRVADMQRETETFENAVRELCQSLDERLLDLPAEDAVEALDERLAGAKEAVNRQQTLSANVAACQRRVNQKTDQEKRFRRQLDSLLEKAGTAGEEEFFKVAARAERFCNLEAQIQRLSHDVRLLCGPEDMSAFQAELDTVEASAIAGRRKELEQEIADREAECNSAHKEWVLARQRLDDLQGEGNAAGLAVELEATRAELSAAVDCWAPLKLAHALMNQAVARFEREHQPRMLSEVSRLFEKMTLGRYVGIRRKLDARGTLLLIQRDGEMKEPQQLSTGTREQLYLAIRLAYVLEYCQRAEPLPLVMDDVLVNFDDDRKINTLDVLLEIAERVQVLFMTCHRSIVRLIQDRAPQIPTTELVALSNEQDSPRARETAGSRAK